MERSQSLLSQLIAALQDTDEAQTTGLVNAIRASTSLDDVRTYCSEYLRIEGAGAADAPDLDLARQKLELLFDMQEPDLGVERELQGSTTGAVQRSGEGGCL